MRQFLCTNGMPLGNQSLGTELLGGYGDLYLRFVDRNRDATLYPPSSLPAGPYHIEVRWPDGRRRSASIQLEAGRREGVFLNADLETVSRRIIAPRGSNTCLMTDRVGRQWVVGSG